MQGLGPGSRMWPCPHGAIGVSTPPPFLREAGGEAPVCCATTQAPHRRGLPGQPGSPWQDGGTWSPHSPLWGPQASAPHVQLQWVTAGHVASHRTRPWAGGQGAAAEQTPPSAEHQHGPRGLSHTSTWSLAGNCCPWLPGAKGHWDRAVSWYSPRRLKASTQLHTVVVRPRRPTVTVGGPLHSVVTHQGSLLRLSWCQSRRELRAKA